MDDRQGGVGALEGLDLGRLVGAAPLSPAQAAAVGLGILSALEDLHETGRSAGALTAADVLVGGDGRVRLRGAGHDHGSSSDLMADLRQAGLLICAALGISVESDPGTLRPAERAMPAVCATARAIAHGAMGRNVGLARAQFADTAGSLLAPERLRLSETELAEHVREVVREPAPALRPQAAPPPAPPPIGRPAPPARVEKAPPPRALERPVSDWERRRARRFEEDRDRGFPMAGIAAVVGVLLVLGVAGALGAFVVSKLMVAGPGTPVVAVTPSPAIRSTPSAQAQPSPQPSPVATLPTYAPPAQGTIKSVVLALNGDCAAGSNCALEVTLNFTKASAATDYQWTYKAFDPCTGASTDVSTWHFTAQQGWIQIISDHPVKLPAARAQLYVVVVTTSPDQAQSPALTVGQGSC